MIKLIATDLDGTLLNSKSQLSQKTIDVLKKAKEQGIYVVPCTGRPLASIQGYLKELGLYDDNDYSITFNGGLVQHNQSGEVIYSAQITKEESQKIVDFLNNKKMSYDLLCHDYLLAPAGQEESFYERLNHQLPVKHFEQFTALECNKIVVNGSEAEVSSWLDDVFKAFGDDFYVVRTMPELLEIASKKVGKEKGIAQLCQFLNLSMDQVISFGDEANDIEMLEQTGMGIAMENASEVVKQAANFVTKTNDENGVAIAIEALLEGSE